MQVRFSNFLYLLFFFIFSWKTNVFSQDQLQFIENKGQWHESVTYKGDLSAGMFILTKDGYKVILHNMDDLTRIGEVTHRHVESEATKSSAGLQRPMAPQMPTS